MLIEVEGGCCFAGCIFCREREHSPEPVFLLTDFLSKGIFFQWFLQLIDWKFTGKKEGARKQKVVAKKYFTFIFIMKLGGQVGILKKNSLTTKSPISYPKMPNNWT